MKYIRLILCLLLFVPAGILAGALTWYHGSSHSGPAVQMVIGGALGLFFGLVFGGVRGRWLSWFYPPGDERYKDD